MTLSTKSNKFAYRNITHPRLFLARIRFVPLFVPIWTVHVPLWVIAVILVVCLKALTDLLPGFQVRTSRGTGFSAIISMIRVSLAGQPSEQKYHIQMVPLPY